MDIFVPILKVDASRREVHGVMAEEARDRANEIFDYESSKPYVQAWSREIEKTTDGKSAGNVRGQHGKIAAGKLVSIKFDDATKTIPVVARIVDNNEWQKVQEGVYNGFSIGGSYVKKWADGAATRYTAKPTEVSLVDHPCMYGATFQLVKADGAFEYRGFAGVPPSQSDGMAEVRQRIAELGKVVDAYVARHTVAPSARFQPQGEETATVLKFVAGMPGGVMLESDIADAVEASRQHSVFVTKTHNGEAVAAAELRKALDNGTPVGFQSHSGHGAAARFRPAETVAPGVQRFRSASDGDANFHETPGNTLDATHNVEKTHGSAGERRQFQPGGQTDLGKADAECRDALTKGRPVGR
jgi:hypothetical protein